MKIKRFFFAFTTAVLAFSLCAGCDTDPSLSKKTGLSKSGGLKPTIAGVSTPANFPGADQLSEVPIDTDEWFINITFTREMDPDTIIRDNVYLNDCSGGTPVRVSPQEVSYDRTKQAAVLVWTSTSDTLELVVTSSVEDITGENLSGLGTYFGPPIDDIASDFRIIVDPYGTTTWTPDFLPEVIVLSFNTVTTDSANVVATTGVDQLDPDTVTDSLFSISPAGTVGTSTNDLDTGATYTVPYSGLSESVEYIVTLNTSGIAIDHTTATRTYPDGSTAIPILGGNDIVQSYSGGGAVQTSDYQVVFKTQDSGTPPTLDGVTNETVIQGYAGILPNNAIIQIDYDIEMDATAVVDTDNYIFYDAAWNPLEVDITPYFETTDTFLNRVLVSTKNYSQSAIAHYTIKHGVISTTQLHLDGDSDGVQSGGSDYDLDGTPDDWVTL